MMATSRDNIVNANEEEAMHRFTMRRTVRRSVRERARREAELAGFWGRQALGNINLGLDIEAVRKAARNAAHHYRAHEELLGRGQEAPTMHAPTFDDVAAAERRRSWEALTHEEQEELLAPDRKAYGQERAIRTVLAVYITNLRATLKELAVEAVEPTSLVATAAVVRVAGELGAIACATATGRMRVLVDNNAVTYYAERWRQDITTPLPDPVIDPLLEELAAALGCAWTWIDDEAIELVRR